MDSRRGIIFFWIAQALLLPALATFFITAWLHFLGPAPMLAHIGLATALVQIPATALSLLFAVASYYGQLLSPLRIRLLFAEIATAALMIATVFAWRDVYRPM